MCVRVWDEIAVFDDRLILGTAFHALLIIRSYDFEVLLLVERMEEWLAKVYQGMARELKWA